MVAPSRLVSRAMKFAKMIDRMLVFPDPDFPIRSTFFRFMICNDEYLT